MIQTEHRIAYLANANTENWGSAPNPMAWLLRYTTRNKIPKELIEKPVDRFVNGKTEPYIRLTFKSERQLQVFQRRGNDIFPYVEFL